MSNEDDPHVEANLEVIREYLRSEFKEFEPTDKSEGSFGHLFTVMNISAYTRHSLKVSGPRLSDRSNTPERSKRQLALYNIAIKMRATKIKRRTLLVGMVSKYVEGTA